MRIFEMPPGNHNLNLIDSKMNCLDDMFNIDGLVQEKRNLSALEMELRLPCINPLIYELSNLTLLVHLPVILVLNFQSQSWNNHNFKTKLWTWYHNQRCQQFVLSLTLRIFKVLRWLHRWSYHHKNNCIWHNLLCWLGFCSQILQFYNHPKWLPMAVSREYITHFSPE